MSSQLLKRLAGPALTLGGLLWISIYVFTVIGGLITGKLVWLTSAHQPLLAHIYFRSLPLSYLLLCVGLLGGFARLEGRSRRSGITGFVFASIGTATSILLIFLTIITISPDGLPGALASLANGINGLSTLAGTLFLGWAALRAHMLPRPIAWILIVISIVTLPILLLTPLPVGPAWATDTLAFLLSGIGFAVVGVTLIMAWKHAENSDGMSGLADHAPSQWTADDAP